MNNTQAQLFHVALNEKDIVYTPDDVARDVVAFFRPTGKILEPCSGDGAFMRYLPPDTEWCEIERGRDFFAYHKRVDWIIGNPPYSIFGDWLAHSFEIADNIIYLIPIRTPFNSMDRMKMIYAYGGIRTIYIVANGGQLGFDFGLPVGAVHFQRGYTGGIEVYFRVAAPHKEIIMDKQVVLKKLMDYDPEIARIVADLYDERDAVVFAAHMPTDYKFGLPSWVNQVLYASYLNWKDWLNGKVSRAEDVEQIAKLQKELAETRAAARSGKPKRSYAAGDDFSSIASQIVK